MKKIARKLSLLLAVLMIFTAVPTQVFAEESGDPRVVDMPDSETEIDTPDSSDDDVDTPDSGDEDKKEDNGDSVVDEPVADGEELLEEEIPEAEVDEATPVMFTVTDGVLGLSDSYKDKSKYEHIKRQNFPDGVTEIPTDIFSGATNLEDIEIPTTVKTFGKGAFAGCTKLTTVKFCDVSVSTVPDGKGGTKDVRTVTSQDIVPVKTEFSEEMFKDCKALKWSSTGKVFRIPENVKKIGKNCFYGCTSVTSITFINPSQLDEIGEGAFSGCTSLIGLNNFENTKITSIEANTFFDTKINEYVTFPDTLTTIKREAFASLKSGSGLDLSNSGVTTIQPRAFVGLSDGKNINNTITTISLPRKLTTITADSFVGCTSLKTMNIDYATTIKSGAFNGANNLAEVNLGSSVVKVEDDAFGECKKLMTIRSYHVDSVDDEMDLAIDAFPLNKGMVMYGMGGNFEEWAGNNYSQGVIYKPLEGGMRIEYNAQYDGNMVSYTPTTGVSKDVLVTVTTTPGFNEVTVEFETEVDANGEPKKETKKTEISRLISLTTGSDQKHFVGKDQTFRVCDEDIKDGKVWINAVFANTQRKNDTKFYLEAMQSSNNLIESQAEPIIYFENAGENAQLNIRVMAGRYDAAYSNPWMWTFSSSNSGNVTIDSNGKIKAIKKFDDEKKYATITAENAEIKQKFTIKVHVGADRDTSFDHVKTTDAFTFSKCDSGVVAPTAGVPASAVDESNIIDSNQYVKISRGQLNTALSRKLTKDFMATINAVDASGNVYDGTFEWTSSNTAIVKVPTKKTIDDNSNKIQVCGIGEATVTVQRISKNTKNQDVKEESYTFVVQTRDMSPYVTDDYLAINSASPEVTIGSDKYRSTDLNILSAYAEEILYSRGATVVKKSGNSYEKSITKWKDKTDGQPYQCDDFVVTNPTATSATININVNSQYYKDTTVKGLYLKVVGADKAPYYVELPPIIISTKRPVAKVQLSGKLNTFYKGSDSGLITAKITLPNGYNLNRGAVADFTLADYEVKNEVHTGFSDNFIVDSYNDGELIIKQKSATIKNERIKEKGSESDPGVETNKPATTGILKITYKNGVVGETKITIPTAKQAVKLIPEFTSVVANSNAGADNQTFDMILKNNDKNKTKCAIDATYTVTAITSDDLAAKAKSTIGYAATAAALGGDDDITFTVPKAISNGNSKIVYTVQKNNWTEPLTFTMNVKKVNTKAELKLAKGSVEVNKLGDKTADLGVLYKSPDMSKYCTGYVFLDATGKDGAALPAGLTITQVGTDIRASVTSATPKGTHKIELPYKVTYVGGNEEPGTLKFNVSVVEKKNSLKLKNTAFGFNVYVAGKIDSDTTNADIEVATTTFTTVNVKAGTIDTSSAQIFDVTDSKNPVEYTFNQGSLPIKVDFTTNTMSVLVKTPFEKTKTYIVSGAKIGTATLEDIKFTVKPNSGVLSMNVSPKGKLNAIDSTSEIVYTVTLKNFNGAFDFSKFALKEYTDKNRTQTVASDHFVATAGATPGTVVIKIKSSQAANMQNQKYFLKACYDFDNEGTMNAIEKDFEITPSQTLPGITVSQKKFNLYYTDKTVTLHTKVTPKQVATIDTVTFTGKDAAKFRKQFTLTSDADGNVTVKIKDPALLQKGKTYSLPCEVRYENQLTNTTGPKFNIKVVVK